MRREIIAGIFVSIVTAIFVYLFTRKSEMEAAFSGASGGSSGGAFAGSGGAGGAGGSASFTSLSELAAAVDRLAAGVQVPVFRTESVFLATAGRVAIAPAESGKQLKVFAYCVTTPSDSSDDVQFWSGASKLLWPMKLTPVAGSMGANLATSWPSYLFASSLSEGLEVVVEAQCSIVIVYWSE